mgnify:CR=1 FL=1|tara:strand:- start:1579 stop:2574 length:996 start_codon:yes stop_codon:yes gene_type:complete
MNIKKSNLKTGVIGVGSMGSNHARVYSEISNLVAVSEPNEKVGRSVAEKFGIEWYADYRDMLDKVDAVTISVPTIYHREIAEEVATSGTHFLVEKPLSNTIEDAQAIISASEKYKVIMAVGHIERYNPAVRSAWNNIDSGAWGNILSLTANRFSNFPSRIKDVGVLFDLTIHDIDVLCYLAQSDVHSVYCTGGKLDGNDSEDFINLNINFDNGILGLCETNWVTPMKIRKLEIKTMNKFVKLDYQFQELEIFESNYKSFDNTNIFKSEIKVLNHKENIIKAEPLKLELLDFLNSISNNTIPLVSGLDGLQAVKIAHHALKSMETNTITYLK